MTRTLAALTAAVVAVGLAGRLRGGGMRVERVAEPTVTPIASAFDEMPVVREVTLPGETWYAIQTGVFSSREAASSGVDLYRDRGAPGIVAAGDGQYRVLIAAYGEKSDAAAVREKLSERQNVDTYVYAWTCPEVTLRLSGMAGQVDVAEAGLTLTLQAARRLRDAAMALDQGGMTAEEVRALLLSADQQVDTWRSAAADRFSQPYPPLMQAEFALAEDWRAVSAEVSAALRQGSTALSAAMKCGAMTLYARVLAMREGVTDS